MADLPIRGPMLMFSPALKRSEEVDTAIPVTIARKVTRCTPIDETKPLVVGDWLSDKDILAWLNHKLYYN